MILRLPRPLRALGLALLVAVLPILSSCYVPDEFAAEIRVARNGDYSLTYTGILTWAPLYMQIVRGEVTGDAVQEKIEAIRHDIKRDPQFTNVRSMGRGQFAVSYKRTGNLVANPGMVTFVRRNAKIFNIDARADGTVTVYAETPNIDKARPMAEAGLLVRGTLRVISDMRVVDPGNPTAVYSDKDSDWKVYDWILDGTKPIYPQIVFHR
jgi:hypothetical protein